MSITYGALLICAIIGLVVTICGRFDTDWNGHHNTWVDAAKNGGFIAAMLTAVVVVVWFVVAVPISTIARNTCEREADGYQLDYDWSIRNGCRIELPSGQLVPSSKIRITDDGEIVTGAS